MKAIAKSVFKRFGFEVSRLQRAPLDQFEVQRSMIPAACEPIIFDVGAHMGAIAKRYRELFPTALIHSFEPTPAAVEFLQLQFVNDHKFWVHQVALSEKEGTEVFHLNHSGSTNSLLETDANAPENWQELVKTEETISVSSQTVDRFCRDHQIDRIDILKIDVQGAELKVLEGAREMLSRGAIRSVYLEVIVAPTYLNQPGPHKLFNALYAAGLRLVDFYDVWKKDSILLQFDALFAGADQIAYANKCFANGQASDVIAGKPLAFAHAETQTSSSAGK